MNTQIHTAFLCHASEDKDEIARPLAEALRGMGWDIWIDESELSVGDSLWSTINEALVRSTFGIVVLSPRFFAKDWPLRELQALSSREMSTGEKVILPVWHDIDRDQVVARMPLLGDRLGAHTSSGISAVAEELVAAFAASTADAGQPRRLLTGLPSTDTKTGTEDGVSQDILTYADRYRSQVAGRCSQIIPPHVDTARRIPINELYVAPSLEPILQSDSDEAQPQALQQFASSFSQTVVLGKPGSGKSTLSQKLCFDIGSSEEDDLVPVLVVLREFGPHRAEGKSVVEFVEHAASAKYQLPEPPSGTFDCLFSEGRCVVIFDGLDELLDASDRQEIARDVESFCSVYPAVPVMVTSREVGYSQAPLDEHLFDSCRLSDFDQSGVALYAERWFRSIPDLPDEEADQLASAFVVESAAVPDLRSNALMLALMCNIYRGERYIPTNRPDVYEKCARMLFERWDRSRGIVVELPFRTNLFQVMQYLAHWIYGDQDLQNGVRSDELVAKTAEYLLEWQFEDSQEALSAAEQFVAFCAGRAWVFTDAGLAADDTALYQFTHRTFLEYFTAAQIHRCSDGPDPLMDALAPRIAGREWDIVAQLAFQMMNQSSAGAADQMLERLLAEADSTGEPQAEWNILAFAARALQFLVPKPQTRRAVSRTVLTSVADGIDDQEARTPAREAFEGILTAASENIPALVDEAEQVLSSVLATSAEESRVRIADLVLRHLSYPPDNDELWSALRVRLVDEFSDSIYQLAHSVHPIAVEWVILGRMGAADFLEAHRPIGLYEWSMDLAFGHGLSTSLSDRLVAWTTYGLPADRANHLKAFLADLGDSLIATARPWIPSQASFVGRPHVSFDVAFSDSDFPLSELDPSQSFGLFCLLAVHAEHGESGGVTRELRSWVTRGTGALAEVAPLLLARQDDDRDLDALADHVLRLGFTVDQRRFIVDWMAGESDLLGPADAGE